MSRLLGSYRTLASDAAAMSDDATPLNSAPAYFVGSPRLANHPGL